MVLTNIASTPVLDLSKPNHFYIFAFLVALAIWAFYKYLNDTIYGACCLASKINEDKLKFLGYSNFKIRLDGFRHRQYDNRSGRFDVCNLSGFVSPEMTSAHRAADPVVVTILGGVGTLYGPDRRGDRLHRHEGPDQRTDRQLGALHRLSAGFIMLAGEKGIWGTLEPLLEKALFGRMLSNQNDRVTIGDDGHHNC